MNTIISTHIKPKEITLDCDSELEYASFEYYDGIYLAQENGWEQTCVLMDSGSRDNLFVVCCGDVMIQVTSDQYPEIERRLI